MNEKIKSLVERIDEVTGKNREYKREINDTLSKIRNDILKLEKETGNSSDETWEILRKIAQMPTNKMKEVFGHRFMENIVLSYTLDETRETFNAYEEKKDREEQEKSYIPKRGDRVRLLRDINGNDYHWTEVYDGFFANETEHLYFILLDDDYPCVRKFDKSKYRLIKCCKEE